MSTNKKIGFGILGVLILGIVFFLGASYGVRQLRSMNQGGRNFSQDGLGVRGNRILGNMGEFTTGEIILKDDKSITVKLTDGGSKIIFLGATTKISKSAEGSLSDLVASTQVSITGTANTDGSINAQMVQIRPKSPVN